MTTPFPCCILPNFIQDKNGFLDSLKDDLLRLKYYEKDNDLYQFHQACVCVCVVCDNGCMYMCVCVCVCVCLGRYKFVSMFVSVCVALCCVFMSVW